MGGRLSAPDIAGIGFGAGDQSPQALRTSSGERPGFLSTLLAGRRDRRLALYVVSASALTFLAAVPFAKLPLPPVPAFIPVYQSAMVVNDLITAALLLGQFSLLRSRALLILATGYLFTGFAASAHLLTFPGLFSSSGLLGAGPQSTAWLYMFWHGGFPAFVIGYALLKDESPSKSWQRGPLAAALAASIGAAALPAAGAALLATAGQGILPPIMQGNQYTPAMIFVVSAVWLMSLVALALLWRRRPHTVLDLWLMVVMCAWLFDVALSAVLNAGRFDLGFYAGRSYGLLAATLVLVVMLVENGFLYQRVFEARKAEGERQVAELARTQRALAMHAERLRILHEIDRAIVAEKPAEAVAAAVIQPLREVLDVPRVIVNQFDLAAGEVEWIAAAGRRRTHVGPGVRYSIRLMGDLDALRRGEPQIIDVHALPPGPDTDALLASGVHRYMAVPMIAGDELLGALSFGGDTNVFPPEQVSIAKEVATQLAIAIAQARLVQRVKEHAAVLETRVSERTAALEAANKELESFSYSVSHDLRAPLRGVDGYARMLEEDHGPRLDEEGRRLLGVVRHSARQMGQLIDDLLDFSRLGRQQLRKLPLDMSALAQEVVDELRPQWPEAEVRVTALPPALADRALMRQVWLNLIGNALKYSAKRKDARVDIGVHRAAHEDHYWVRDNGAGFDMRYAHKLFGVFQRLHGAHEFSGTGVGLAIVQRVIARHGGRVWAESKLGEGACFYFALPEEG